MDNEKFTQQTNGNAMDNSGVEITAPLLVQSLMSDQSGILWQSIANAGDGAETANKVLGVLKDTVKGAPASTGFTEVIHWARSAVDLLIPGLLGDPQIGDILKLVGVSIARVKAEVKKRRAKQRRKALMTYGRDLTELAGKLDPVIGREEEIRRVVEVLSMRTKNNPVLIGDPGVGKTAVVEGLAQRILRRDVPR